MKRPPLTKRLITSLCLVLLLSVQSGCAYTNRGKTEAYFDTQMDKSQLLVNRVAIIPNRLPLVMKEPEYWRKANWELIAAAFRQHGYEVVDFDSSNKAFREANLPIEDTGSSEEKFAQAASQLNADILLMPYYSTSFTGNSVAVFSEMKYTGLVSLQIYSAHDNRFVFRSDADGNSGFSAYSGLFSLALSAVSGASSASGTGSSSSNQIFTFVSLGVSVAGLIFAVGDIVNGLTPEQEWWKRAFTEAINGSLEPFFSVYPKPAPIATPTPAPVAAPASDPAVTPADPAVSPQPSATPRETLEDILNGR